MPHLPDFVPSPDCVRETIESAKSFISALYSWSPCHCGLGDLCSCRTDTTLPSFPTTIGNSLIIEKLHRLERSLNPCRLPSDHIQRKLIEVIGWPQEVRLGFMWLVDLTGRFLGDWDLAWLSVVEALRDGPPQGVPWSIDTCRPLIVFVEGMSGLKRAVEHLEVAMTKVEPNPPLRDAREQALLPIADGIPWRIGGFLTDGTVQGTEEPKPHDPCRVTLPPLKAGSAMSLTAAEARKRLMAVASVSRTFVQVVREDPMIANSDGPGEPFHEPRYLLRPQSLRIVRAVRRILHLKNYGCGITPILEEASAALDAASLAGYAQVCEFWADWKDRDRSERVALRDRSDVEPESPPPTIGVGEIASLERVLCQLEGVAARADEPGPESPGSERSGSPPGRSIEGKAERKFKRGELDDQAATVLAMNPGWTNDQIARNLGCHVKSLSSPRLRRFHKHRELLADGKEAYRDADRTPRGRRRRMEAETDDR